jgi:hypothetical protein
VTTTKFPKTIYARIEKIPHEKETYLVVDYPGASGNDGDRVAVYTLTEVKTKRIVESLV